MPSVAIMQPSYLPWLGYFALMKHADLFVLLDDVQFQHRSWQHRNRICIGGRASWLTIPVAVSGNRGQELRSASVDKSSGFPTRHESTLRHAYRQSGHWSLLGPALAAEITANAGSNRLMDFTVNTLTLLARILGIDTPIKLASELSTLGRRGEHLARICEAVQCDTYLAVPGSTDYLTIDKHHFSERGINILTMEYAHPVYPQRSDDFISHLSVVDLMFNTGADSRDILLSGVRGLERL